MARIAPMAWLAATLGATAAHAASFKKAPGSDGGDPNNPLSFDFDPGWEGEAGVWFDWGKEILVNYYGYFGVAFVLLCLMMFGRGSKGDSPADKAERRSGGGRRRHAATGEEDYYDIEGLDDLLEENAR
jgi:hypothetical protein